MRFVGAILCLVILMACKKEGCRDTNAINYNAVAKKDCINCCEYPEVIPVSVQEAILGEYTMNDSLFIDGTLDTTRVYILTITRVEGSESGILLNNLFNQGVNFEAVLKTNTKTFSIPPQVYNAPITLSGEISYDSEANTVTYFTLDGSNLNRGKGIK